MTPDRQKRPITDIESDLLDCLLKCPQIEVRYPNVPDSIDYSRASDCQDIAPTQGGTLTAKSPLKCPNRFSVST